jgi:hypothetical protein
VSSREALERLIDLFRLDKALVEGRRDYGRPDGDP